MEILFRGFYADENGNEEIWTNGTCQGEKVKGKVNGEWIYWDKFGKLTKTLKVGKRIWGKGLRVDENDILPETVGQYTGLDDKNGKKIFEGGVVVPVWVSPSGEIDGINEDMQGKVIYKAGSFYVVPRCEMEYQICNYVRKNFIEYRSNVGEIYDFANNMFLGEVIGTVFDKEDK